MKVPDLNILIGAFHYGHPDNAPLRAWLERTLESGEFIGLSPYVATGVIRVLTNKRAWEHPDDAETALAHIDLLRRNPAVIDVAPGPRHWEIFAELCRVADARGNLVSDAAHAAVAIEHGATLVSLDRDFAKFPGLRWELPEVW